MRWKFRLTLCFAVLLVLLAMVWLRRERKRADIAGGNTRALPGLTSSSFAEGGFIPQRLACDGANLSPDLKFPEPPPGTTGFALVVDDPDTPFGFVHWLLYDIPLGTRDIPEGASSAGNLPRGAAEGLNDFSNLGYGGPCPPGTAPHHYIFRLYALALSNRLPPGLTKSQLAAAVKGHVLAEGKMSSLYARTGSPVARH
jgi:Raf kinase inhibitor-like YbhB/YbcL family protein